MYASEEKTDEGKYFLTVRYWLIGCHNILVAGKLFHPVVFGLLDAIIPSPESADVVVWRRQLHPPRA